MFGLGVIKGTILGMTLALISGVVIRELCKKNKKSNNKNSETSNKDLK
tara:strand:+ start:77 stop:220 length:144 start_codon:yes stop_codon:yes gene_type:complete